MSAKNATKSTIAKNDNVIEGKPPVVETPTFNLNDTLAGAEKDVEAAFGVLVLYIASQSQADKSGIDYTIRRLADVLTSEGKAPRASDDPSGAALHKRLKRLFGSKGVLTICNMARVVTDRTPIIG